MRKKKVFQTDRLNNLRRREKRSWLIFLILMAVIGVYFGPVFVFRDSGGHYLQGLFRFLALDLILSACLGLIPFYFVRMGIRGAKKEAFRNCSFITMQNMDYYREKLDTIIPDGITPGGISLLEDLKLEMDKDISASVLRYRQLDLIREDGAGGYLGTEKYENLLAHSRTGNLSEMLPNIRGSDDYLIKAAIAGTLYAEHSKWQKMVAEELKQEGLLSDNAFTGKDLKRAGRTNRCILFLWILCVLIVMPLVIPGELKRYYAEESYSTQTVSQIFSSLPDWTSFLSDMQEDMEKIQREAELYHASSIYEENEYLFSHFYFEKYVIVIFSYLFFILLFLFPFWYGKMGMARLKERAKYKRTERGNEIAEYIWGMKNFIHDFSNLEEADQRALVLWDDYLIYAVVLEENKKIVDEIMKRRKEE